MHTSMRLATSDGHSLFQECVEVNLIVCCSRSHILRKHTNLKRIFGLSCDYDGLRISKDLRDDVRSAKSLSSLRMQLKTYLFSKAYPP